MSEKLKGKVVFDIGFDEDDIVNIKLDFDPSLPGENLVDGLTEDEKILAHYQSKIANYVMEKLSDD